MKPLGDDHAGKSGQSLFRTHDHIWLVKTVSAPELLKLAEMAERYYTHWAEFKKPTHLASPAHAISPIDKSASHTHNSLLNIYLGCYTYIENEYDRCNRLWTIRSLAQYFGYSPSFDPACFPVFIDQPIFYEALSDFGNTSRGHHVCQIALECHNREMRQGFCTPKLEDKIQYHRMYVYKYRSMNSSKLDHCAVLMFAPETLDRCYQEFSDWVSTTVTAVNYVIVNFVWAHERYCGLDLHCSEASWRHSSISLPQNAAQKREYWRYITYIFLNIKGDHLIHNALLQLFLGSWLEIHYGSIYTASLYLVGALIGDPLVADQDRVSTGGPLGPILVIYVTFLMEMSLNGQYWRSKLTMRGQIFCTIVFYAFALFFIIGASNTFRYEEISEPISCRNHILFAVIYWPLSTILLLKGNVQQIKSKLVDSISNLWVEIALMYWRRNPFAHRVTCECFFCRRSAGRNQLWYRQQMVEEKAGKQAKRAISRFLDTNCFSINVEHCQQPPKRPIKNDSVSDPENDSDCTGQNMDDELKKINKLLREAADSEAEAKELAKQRRNMLAELKGDELDPSVKAQMREEIEAIEQLRKQILESAEMKRQNANWASQIIYN
ncbi:rhomboid family domain-containing protein [Ditylenchus destructor]|nr:rhomboid family domain-containing protein [Ditylenchus destructor]